ncbi:uncharacterized protein MKZ38_004268 [Zalerion maritima]|uniref:Uncharacterized protein n=1 Tax=Zalerion maritima TaxID=339359 RepID=A0AAD5RWI7_9PEZI|nr:uncharacterized protein MKZ38_004268 [Zalerion maritima]
MRFTPSPVVILLSLITSGLGLAEGNSNSQSPPRSSSLLETRAPGYADVLGGLGLGLVTEGLVRGFDAVTGSFSNLADLSQDSLDAIRGIIAEELQQSWLERDKNNADTLLDNAGLYGRSANADPSDNLQLIINYADQANELIGHLETYGLQGSVAYITIACLHISLEKERLALQIESDEFFGQETDIPSIIRNEIIEDATTYQAHMFEMFQEYNGIAPQLFRSQFRREDRTCGRVCCDQYYIYMVEQRDNLESDDWSAVWESERCYARCDDTRECDPMKEEQATKLSVLPYYWRLDHQADFMTSDFVDIDVELLELVKGNIDV